MVEAEKEIESVERREVESKIRWKRREREEQKGLAWDGPDSEVQVQAKERQLGRDGEERGNWQETNDWNSDQQPVKPSSKREAPA